jgi:N-methylhydantoinase A
VRERLSAENVEHGNIKLLHFADMRYAGQAYEIRIPFDESESSGSLADKLRGAITAFHVSHKDLYGYSYQGTELIELVNLGVTGLGVLKRPQLPERAKGDANPQAAFKRNASVYFYQAKKVLECPVYNRDALQAGNVIQGPAIVEQYDSTTVVDVGWQGKMDRWGNITLDKIS